MGWYRVKIAHDGMARGLVVEFRDTADVKRRVAKGYLIRTEAPPWQQNKKASNLKATEPSNLSSPELSATSDDLSSGNFEGGLNSSES